MKWIKKRGFIFAASRVKDDILVSFEALGGTNVLQTCVDTVRIYFLFAYMYIIAQFCRKNCDSSRHVPYVFAMTCENGRAKPFANVGFW